MQGWVGARGLRGGQRRRSASRLVSSGGGRERTHEPTVSVVIVVVVDIHRRQSANVVARRCGDGEGASARTAADGRRRSFQVSSSEAAAEGAGPIAFRAAAFLHDDAHAPPHVDSDDAILAAAAGRGGRLQRGRERARRGLSALGNISGDLVRDHVIRGADAALNLPLDRAATHQVRGHLVLCAQDAALAILDALHPLLRFDEHELCE